MNTPAPGAPPANHPAAPTLGSILGATLGTIVATKTGLGIDPVTGGLIISSITGVVTALFHWLGTKIGASW